MHSGVGWRGKLTTLADLHVGNRAQVARVLGSDSITLRLLEMGLAPGAQLSFVGTAMLGDPIEIDVNGYRLSVRKSEAARVQVTPID